MPVKPIKASTLAGLNTPMPIGKAKKPVVKNLSDIVPDSNEHRRLDEMIDQTIYIVNIEPVHSADYGDGFKLFFKDMPNEVATYTAASFSPYNQGQLQGLYDATHNGDKLLPATCVKARIVAAGKSYRLE